MKRLRATRRYLVAAAAIVAAIAAVCQTAVCSAGDLSVVPLFDGERFDALNNWGGPFASGNTLSFGKQSAVVRSGAAAYRANLGSVPAGGNRFFQTFSSELGGIARRQDRDLTQYQSLEGWVRNDTGVPLTFSLELKDYRDSNAQRAVRSYAVPAGGWTQINAPLDLAAGWNVTGSPDLARTYAVGFLVDADQGAASGSLYLDDFQLRERGPGIDVAAAPIETIVERLARRQFMGLWSARNKFSGLVPNRSDDVSVGALNTTTGVLWTLPAAIRRGWVAQTEADAYVALLAESLGKNRDATTYLPSRFLDLATAAPVGNREESPIDAAFIALALHNYKVQPATPAAVRTQIDAVENRFNWTVFDGPQAYNLAYIPGSGFSPYTYSGYTHENKVIALAAELSEAYHVPLESMWNKDVGRASVYLVDPNDRFLVYSYGTEYRAPFAQALLNLFVDSSDRGVDNYPQRTLARNPWINFVRYHDEAADRLALLGRQNFMQPDAGGGVAAYNAYSLFNNHGEPNLFMPWSVAFSLLAGADHAEEALRFLLDNGLGTGLDGPLGLADSARWSTGAPQPSAVASAADNWNMTLSLMAFMEFLEGENGPSRLFAALPEVRSALDMVYVDGDFNASGATDLTDLAIWRSGFGATASATPAAGDGDGDGDVDGADMLRWQRGVGAGTTLAAAGNPVPEPASWTLAIPLVCWALAMRRRGEPAGRRGWVGVVHKSTLKALAVFVGINTIGIR